MFDWKMVSWRNDKWTDGWMTRQMDVFQRVEWIENKEMEGSTTDEIVCESMDVSHKMDTALQKYVQRNSMAKH